MAEIMKPEKLKTLETATKETELTNRLNNLKAEIKENYSLSEKELKVLQAGFEAGKGLKGLREQIKNSDTNNTVNDVNLDNLYNSLSKLETLKQNAIDLSKNDISNLMEKIESFLPNKERNLLKKMFSEKFLSKIDNPENILNHILAVVVNGAESIAVVGKFIGDTLIGLVKLPSDIYKLFSGESKHEKLKDI